MDWTLNLFLARLVPVAAFINLQLRSFFSLFIFPQVSLNLPNPSGWWRSLNNILFFLWRKIKTIKKIKKMKKWGWFRDIFRTRNYLKVLRSAVLHRICIGESCPGPVPRSQHHLSYLASIIPRCKRHLTMITANLELAWSKNETKNLKFPLVKMS